MGTKRQNDCGKSGGLTKQPRRDWPCGHHARPYIVQTKRGPAAECGKCHAGE